MEVRELRIGNLFIEESSNKIIEVIGLEKNRIVFSGMFLDKWQAKPIPLTEELLLKFGFIQQENEYWYKKNILSISIGGDVYEIDGSKNSYCVMRNNPIKYAHQLQNLYFALTNEELTLKP